MFEKLKKDIDKTYELLKKRVTDELENGYKASISNLSESIDFANTFFNQNKNK